MTELFRCRICGEVYFGTHPSHCPHCGAHGKYMVKTFVWKNENQPISEMSDISRKNLEETRDLEHGATQFYRAAAKETKSDQIKGFFKYLARTEKEHYEVASKLLGLPIEDSINEPSTALGSDEENIKKSQELEEHVTELYTKFANEAVEPRIKEVFEAVVEVESDHITLDKEELERLNKA